MSDAVTWTETLKAELGTLRERELVPRRESLSELDELKCRILGGHLMSWLSQWGPKLLRERAALPLQALAVKQPLIVYLTDMPGLVAAGEILGEGQDSVIACRAAEFRSLAEYQQDPECAFHCELESWFEPAFSPELKRDLRRRYAVSKGASVEAAVWRHYGIAKEGQLWVHHDCSVMGPLFARGARHLWHFDGRELKLVEEAFSTWVS